MQSAKEYSEETIKEKLLKAESHVANVRLVVLLFCSFIYHFILDDFFKISRLATLTMVLAFSFAAFMFFYKPYKKYPAIITRYFSVSADAVFITLWILSTGRADSPFFLLWCLSIISVAQKFSFKATMFISVIYALTYYCIAWFDPFSDIDVSHLVVRVSFLPIVGILAAYFSREIDEQMEDKFRIRDSENKIREIYNNLNEQMNQKSEVEFQLKQIQLHLEHKVEERTNDFRILNEQLKKILREKEKIQHEQEKTLRRLEQSNKELESFAYITSHDLKAPLRGIATIADWLHQDYEHKLDDEGRSNLQLLKQRAQKMNDLIEGILQYSRIGKTDFQSDVVNVPKLINDIKDLLQPASSISLIVSDQIPLLLINKTLLMQVFENLISNAINHMKNGGTIIIDVLRKQNECVFFVMDTGPGIDARYHEKIFEMFQTLNQDKSSENTGMGLAIVKKIISSFNGRLWVESEPGKGSSFYFSIPNSMVKENEFVHAN